MATEESAQPTFCQLEDDSYLPVSIESDDEFFSRKLDMIDLKYYLPNDDDLRDGNSKFYHNKDNSAPKRHVKETSKKASKKRVRYGETSVKNNIDMVVDFAKSKENSNRDDDSKLEESDRETEGADESVSKATPAKSIEELRERLVQKLQKLRSKRRLNKPAVSDDKAKKKIRKRKSIDKFATSEKKDKVQEYQGADKSDNNESSGTKLLNVEDGINYEEILRKSAADSILNSDTRIVSNVTFPSDSKSKKGSGSQVKEDKKKAGKNSLFNVKQLLKKAEENKLLVDELRQSSNPESRAKADAQIWDKLERKAKGEKILEPKQLKKKVASLERKKEKSAEAWAARIKGAEDEKKNRQGKREANIKKRQEDRVAKKLKRKNIELPKRDGPVRTTNQKRPGLEGRHSAYLNDVQS